MASRCILAALALLAIVQCVSALDCQVESKSDCGYVGIDEQQCVNRGCCWQPSQSGAPWCFHGQTSVPQWVVGSSFPSATGITAQIKLANAGAGTYGPALNELQLQIDFDTDSRAHFKLTDPSRARYEIPEEVLPVPPRPSQRPENMQYEIRLANRGDPFSLQLIRTSDQVAIFTMDDLEYSDQFLQLSNLYPESERGENKAFIYGLGEHVMNFRLPLDGHSFTLWNVDEATPWDQNIYGAHPFYMQTLANVANPGAAHGFFLRNSNGMDILTQNDRVTFRAIGGVLDWYTFTGPTHESVLQQYHELIGRPHFPPFWSLGWHQCKYGWKSIQEVQGVVSNYVQHQIPLDTIWGDIDYMDKYLDFTWDPVNYPLGQVQSFTQKLHANGMKYVVIIDPGIHNQSGYDAYDQGLARDIFIKQGDGQSPYIGKVWPGTTAFPDFLNPNTSDYWQDQIEKFLGKVPYDGLWIDMNEISNFYDGGSFFPDAPVNNPPYQINNLNRHATLDMKTIPADAMHAHGKYIEYDVHNLYGLSESIATKSALEKIQQKRSFILSRSTFSGSGKHVAHWLGDNHATWDDLYRALPGILNMNLFGVPMVGSDICGFIGTTAEELCARWQSVGAFYPFARNHHEPNGNQEPYLWPSVEAVTKKTLAMRYALLPYLYTLMWQAHTNGGSVIRSLMHNFPQDPTTYPIDKQFMWGSGLVVTPVIEQGATDVWGYFPPTQRWYSIWNMSELVPPQNGWVDLPCAIEDGIQVHVAGGNILPMQGSGMTTAESRQTPFSLRIGTGKDNKASGSLFWDSGDELEDFTNSLEVDFKYDANWGISSEVRDHTFRGDMPKLSSVFIGGFPSNPTSVVVNSQAGHAEWMVGDATWQFDESSHTLKIEQFQLDLTKPISIVWTL